MRQHKHDWRKVAGTYSAEQGLVCIRKRCLICGEEKELFGD